MRRAERNKLYKHPEPLHYNTSIRCIRDYAPVNSRVFSILVCLIIQSHPVHTNGPDCSGPFGLYAPCRIAACCRDRLHPTVAGPERQKNRPLFRAGIVNAVGVLADKAVPHGDGELAEYGVGPFHRALNKIRADYAGTTDFLGTPYVEYIHRSAFLS